MGGLLPHFLMLKIKGYNYMLSSWNFIYKYIGPSYVHWTQQKVWPSAATSTYGGYFHGSQSKKCENRPYLENRVPIFKISQKFAWKFSLATETLLKKTERLKHFLPPKWRHQFLTWRHFRRFLIKTLLLKWFTYKLAGLLILTLKSQK